MGKGAFREMSACAIHNLAVKETHGLDRAVGRRFIAGFHTLAKSARPVPAACSENEDWKRKLS